MDTSNNNKRQRVSGDHASETNGNGNATTTTMTRLSFGAPHLTMERKRELEATAAAICTAGKGIVACDESAGTIGARFQAVGVENTEENRRQYRQMLFETTGCETFLSAAILDPETLYQKSSTNGKENKLFPEVLRDRGIVPGVKPHLKVYELPGTNGDTVMQGLDSLNVRAREYYQAGARFAKWRSPLVIDMSKGCPTDLAIKANMHDLARYALICQSEGLMPIVEPDISLKGTHTLEQAIKVNVKVQSELFKAMIDHGVFMAGATLKPNMINPGKDCTQSYTVEEIAEANIFVLEQSFPVAMKGANYLSGGQSLEDAAARLSAMNQVKGKGPWNLSFSWSQALQLPLLDLCKDKGELQLEDMSKLYIDELKIASAASLGTHQWKKGEGDHVGVKVKELARWPHK
jgi:fructose-bisphosphate aldolase class I